VINQAAAQSDSLALTLHIQAKRPTSDAFLSAWVQLDNGLVYMPDKYYYVTDKKNANAKGKIQLFADSIDVYLDTSKFYYWGQTFTVGYMNYFNQPVYISGFKRGSYYLTLNAFGIEKATGPGHPGSLNISVSQKVPIKEDWLEVYWSNGNTSMIRLKYHISTNLDLDR
jgi:hypothetical protein